MLTTCTHRNTLRVLEHLLRDLVGVVLLGGHDQDTLEGLGLLTEHEEHNLGALRSV